MRGKVVKSLRRVTKTLTTKVQNEYNVQMLNRTIETGKTNIDGTKEVRQFRTVGTIRLTPDSPKAILKELKRGHHA